MNLIKTEFVDDLRLLFEKHGYSGRNDIYRPHALGQAMSAIGKPCVSNSAKWYVDELYASYVINSKGNEILKNLVTQLEARNIKKEPYNYCDMDCNLWGKHMAINTECFDCDVQSNVDIFGKDGEHIIKQENCDRCNGTGIDPEFKDNSYVVWHDNHGNSRVFVLIENPCGWCFHIREMPYNLKKGKMFELFKRFCKSSTIGRYDDDFEYMRYHDSRDKGFVFSMQYSNSSYSDPYITDVDSVLHAYHAIDTLIGHFPCVFKE